MRQWTKGSDAALVHQTLSGKRASFERLVERHAATARALALAHVRTHSDAEDVVQDAFVEAFRCLDTLREPARFGAWLGALVRHRAARVKAQRKREADFAESHTADEPVVQPDAAQRETWLRVRQAVEELDPDAREVVVLRYFAGKTSREIGDILDLAPATVRKRLQRARHELAETLLHEAGAEDLRDQRSTKGILGAIAAATPEWSVVETGSTTLGVSMWSTGWAKMTGTVAALIVVVCGGIYSQVPKRGSTSASPTVDQVVAETGGSALEHRSAAPTPGADDAATSNDANARGESSWPLHVRIVDEHSEPQSDLPVKLVVKNRKQLGFLHDYYEKMPFYSARARTNDRGVATFTDIPGGGDAYEMSATTGERTAWKRVTAQRPHAPERSWTLHLVPTETMTGRVEGPNGVPVAGANVHVRHHESARSLVVSPSMNHVMAKTDSRGHFQLTGLVRGRASIDVIAQGYARKVAFDLATNAQDLLVTLRRGRRLEGTVAFSDTGEAATGISIAVTNGSQPAVSDEDGRFVFDSLYALDYRLWSPDPDYVLSTINERVSLKRSDVSNKIVYVERGGEVTGTLTDAVTGEPLPNVLVYALDTRDGRKEHRPTRSGRMPYESATDAKGRFHIRGLPAGPYAVAHRAHGTIPLQTPISNPLHSNATIQTGQVSEIHLTVTRRRAITGSVVDERGNGQESYSIIVWGNNDKGHVRGLGSEFPRAQTDFDGRFTAYAPEGVDQVYVRARRPGWVTQRIGPIRVPKNGISNLRLVAARAGSIAGTMLDEFDRAKSGQVEISSTDHGAVTTLVWKTTVGSAYVDEHSYVEREFLSSRDGYFFAGALYPGEYTVRSGQTSIKVFVSPGQRIDDLKLRKATHLEGGGRVAGRVLLHGKPVQGVSVEVGEYPDQSTDTTDEKGAFLCTAVKLGEQSIRVSVARRENGGETTRDARQKVLITKHKTLSIDLSLGTGSATVFGSVLQSEFANGSVYGNVRMTIGDGESYEETVRVHPDAKGRYRIEGVPAGNHEIHYRIDSPPGPDRFKDSVELDLAAGAVIRHDFHVSVASAQLSLSGMRPGEVGWLLIVRADLVEPSMAKEAYSKLERRASIERVINSDGTYEISRIPAGNQAIYFGAYDGSRTESADTWETMRYSSALVYLEPEETTELALELR